MQPKTFYFERYSFDEASGMLRLAYAFEGGPHFEETILFPMPAKALDAPTRTAIDRIFRLLFLLAGVSYYKAYVPQNLVCKAFGIAPDLASWMEKVYLSGLGEFAYRNNIDLTGKICFQATGLPADTPLKLDLRQEILVPVGGGKDSVVTIEALKSSGFKITGFALGGTGGPAAPIAATLEQSGLPSLSVARTIAPALIELNKTGVYNGHVPITAILSVIAVACAVLHGIKAVAMSNERSASIGNLERNGLEINHQYSKSFEFEMDLAGYIATRISPDIQYFSLLRPLSEIDISRRFSKLTAYHGIFRSCNTAFRQDPSKRGTHWCGKCPKCRFVFLALAPFMPREKLVGIFGFNLLDDPEALPEYESLCGITAYKPFECVGETTECAALVAHLSKMPDWQESETIRTLAPKLSMASPLEKFFQCVPEHSIPATYIKAIES